MKKRVFILSNSKLPHGDANSNYILYMSKALAYAGWDVIAIGSHNGEDRTEVQVVFDCAPFYCVGNPVWIPAVTGMEICFFRL